MAPAPKQVTVYESSHLQELQGGVSEDIINKSMHFVGPIPEGAYVHDNACGSGAVTECIMTAKDPAPPPNLHIDATDINDNFVTGTAALVKQHNWPVTVAKMDVYNLTFPDNRFDQSFATFAFHCLADGPKAAANVYRTLKPGGTLCAAVWIDMPHSDAIKKAHWVTRGEDGPMPVMIPREDYTTDQFRAALKEGGFEEAKTRIHFVDAALKVSDVKRWSQLAWSYLGVLPHGWEECDEEKWDHALAIIEDGLKTGRNTTSENGVLTITMTAAVAIATK